MTPSPRLIAAVRFGTGDPVDGLLNAVVDSLTRRNLRVAGCLQRKDPVADRLCGNVILENLGNGKTYDVLQARGPGASGCRLNPEALAEAAGDIASSLVERPDILVLNRFGRGEAEGHGFRGLIELAFGLELPVLIAVSDSWSDHWISFCGNLASDLPVDADMILAWCDAILSARAPMVRVSDNGH